MYFPGKSEEAEDLPQTGLGYKIGVSVDGLRDQLTALAPRRGAPALLCVTGAPGADVIGRIGARIERKVLPVLGFDSLGVPDEHEMTVGWDSARAWQKAMVWHWVRTARAVYCTRPLVLLEGSFDPQYAIAACAANHLRTQVVVLDRGEAGEWPGYLREQAALLGGVVIDARGELDALADRLCVLAARLLISEN